MNMEIKSVSGLIEFIHFSGSNFVQRLRGNLCRNLLVFMSVQMVKIVLREMLKIVFREIVRKL